MSSFSAAVQFVTRNRRNHVSDLVRLQKAMEELEHHPVFKQVRTVEDLQTFMRWHVFAVWDFMSLVKRLQRDLTCVNVPWMPPANAKATRLINEIVLGEESDENLNGGHASHFELYLGAMREVGAEPHEVLAFLRYFSQGVPLEQAMERAGAPSQVICFVQSTLKTACHNQTHEVLGSFFYGRENVIPHMFSALLNDWTVDAGSAPTFVYYLKRHIELDGDSHGPAAEQLIDELLQDDIVMRGELTSAALNAVQQRLALWDALAEQLRDDTEKRQRRA